MTTRQESCKLWRQAHKEEVRQYKQAYRATHQKEIREYNKQYQINHSDQLREQARNKYSRNSKEEYKRSKRYIDTHPEVIARHNYTRRTREGLAICTLTLKDMDSIKSTGCLACETKEDLTIAHNIALSKGGHTTKDNCFCLCRPCNSKMRTKTLAEWRPDLINKLKEINNE